MKNISKSLAMAVIMSVWCGSAYAAIPEGTMEISKGGIAIGIDSTSKVSGVAVGKESSANANCVAVGKNSVANQVGTAIGAEAEATEGSSVALGYRSVADDSGVVSVGNSSAGLTRRIVNVAEGENDTDAVNKKQMEEADADTLKKANEYTDQEIAKISGGASSEALEKLDSKINQTNDRVDRVGATAAALAGIHYQPMAKGQSQVAVGMGGYKGKKATALGLAYQISDRISGSVAGAANGSERMFNVGFNYLFGQHSDKDIAQCAAAPGSVSLKEAELQSQVDSLKADNASMKAEIAELKAMVKALAAK